MTRNYTAEFEAGLLEEVPEGEYVLAVIAAKYVAHLAETDPQLLNGWLVENAPGFATMILGARLNARRITTRRRAAARDFAANADDVDYIGSFAIDFRVAEDDTRIRVGDMTGAHHVFVAREYESSAKTARMLAAFHRAIAKKVGAKRTADVMSEAEYDALYRSIVRAPAVGAA